MYFFLHYQSLKPHSLSSSLKTKSINNKIKIIGGHNSIIQYFSISLTLSMIFLYSLNLHGLKHYKMKFGVKT
jgi:hypothetical protein